MVALFNEQSVYLLQSHCLLLPTTTITTCARLHVSFMEEGIRAINMFVYRWDTSQSLLGHSVAKDFIMTRFSNSLCSLCCSFTHLNLCRQEIRHRLRDYYLFPKCYSDLIIIIPSAILLISNETFLRAYYWYILNLKTCLWDIKLLFFFLVEIKL